MARSWGRIGIAIGTLVLTALQGRFVEQQALAGAGSPLEPTPPPDPDAISTVLEEGSMVHVFDTRTIPGGPWYVNDHTLVQDRNGAWHLFGIFHHEPIGEDTEIDFIHAVSEERDPARFGEASFDPAPAPFDIALRADRAIGETHIWAPHVVAAEGRYWMVYQGGGVDGDHASIRVAESDDLYRWTRVGKTPAFEDFCVARDPMLVRRDLAWALYYTRCDALGNRVSGVAYRLSRNLVDWTEPRMVLTLPGTTPMPNSGFTESPFVFERNGYYYLSVSAYPVAWDATYLYRSPAPFAFPSAPFTRLRGHAAEWLPSADGKRLFMTHAGPGQSGVWIAPVDGI